MSRWSSRSSGQHRHSMVIPAIAFAVAAFGAPAPLAAQRATPSAVVAQPGATVRVWTPGWQYTGTLARVAADTAVIRFASDSAMVPLQAVQRVDVQQGTRRSIGRILVGTGLGAAVGMIVGAYAGVGLECGTSCENDGEWAGLGGAVVGGLTGIVAGGITGGVIGGKKRYPRWVAAELR